MASTAVVEPSMFGVTGEPVGRGLLENSDDGDFGVGVKTVAGVVGDGGLQDGAVRRRGR
jgi:hypothetical protein